MENKNIPVTIRQANGIEYVVGSAEIEQTEEGIVVNGELLTDVTVEWEAPAPKTRLTPRQKRILEAHNHGLFSTEHKTADGQSIDEETRQRQELFYSTYGFDLNAERNGGI